MKKYICHFMVFVCFLSGLCMCACGRIDDSTEDTQLSMIGTFEEIEKVPYTVKVVNEAGQPVANCAIQLCRDVCIPGFTNGDGIAVIRAEKADYKVSVTVAPAGCFVDPDAVYFFENGKYAMTITLKVE